MTSNLDATIATLTRLIDLEHFAAREIHARAARRRLLRAPSIVTPAARLRATRRGYDAVKRAKIHRRRAAVLEAQRAALYARRDEAARAFASLL